jgi:hypothetical protein
MSKEKVGTLCQDIGLALVGLYIFFSSHYMSRFAELHLSVSFFPAPLFISEILLGICLLLIVIIWRLGYLPPIPRSIAWFIGLFFFAFLIKVSYGYWKWGPLAFRNAAMFYYSLFALCGFYFYRKENVLYSPLAKGFSVFLFLCVFLNWPEEKFRFPFLMVLLGLCLFAFRRKGRMISLALWAGLFYIRFMTQIEIKGVFVAYVFALIVILAVWLLYSRWASSVKWALGIGLVLILSFSAYTLHQGELQSLINWHSLSYALNDAERQIRDNRSRIQLPKHVPVKLYEVGSSKEVDMPPPPPVPVPSARPSPSAPPKTSPQKSSSGKTSLIPQKPTSTTPEPLPATVPAPVLPPPKTSRSVDAHQANMVWRILVCKDMFQEWVSQGPLWGIDFGKPFRSERLEILASMGGWAAGWWVGWLEPHNSFLHILYRFGLMGAAFIAGMLGFVGYILHRIAKRAQLAALILCTIPVYWLGMACTQVVLELPYFAIPFWFPLGLLVAYAYPSSNK